MSIPAQLEDQIADLYARIAELERRGQNAKRTGKIAATDYDKGLYRVEFKEQGSDGKPYLSPWLPLKEVGAGDIKVYVPLSMGEQVTVVSENGDLSDAEIESSINSDDNPKPHNKGGEAVVTVKDGLRLTLKDGELTLETTTSRLVCDVTIDGNLHVTKDITNDGNMTTVGTHTDAIGKHDA